MKRRSRQKTSIVPYIILIVGAISLVFVGFTISSQPQCKVEDNKIHIPDHKSDCAHLFMLSSNAYFPCLAVAIHSLQNTGTKNDIIVMVTPNIWIEVKEALQNLDIIILNIQAVKNPNSKIKRTHMTDNFTKLRAWQLTDYKKIIYSDSDFMFTRNSDDLCKLPAAVNAGRNFVTKEEDWVDPDFFNAGFMVISPSAETFCDMIEESRNFESITGGDQPFQNHYWKNKWHELDYKNDGANANAFFSNNDDWDPNGVRSIHFTRATNPCNYKFEKIIQEKWDEFEEFGVNEEEYNPLVLWLQAYNRLLANFPEFNSLFDKCGFMKGWDDGGKAFINTKDYLGFI